eukprot:3411157-Rhodomonas_salina.1
MHRTAHKPCIALRETGGCDLWRHCMELCHPPPGFGIIDVNAEIAPNAQLDGGGCHHFLPLAFPPHVDRDCAGF